MLFSWLFCSGCGVVIIGCAFMKIDPKARHDVNSKPAAQECLSYVLYFLRYLLCKGLFYAISLAILPWLWRRHYRLCLHESRSQSQAGTGEFEVQVSLERDFK